MFELRCMLRMTCMYCIVLYAMLCMNEKTACMYYIVLHCLYVYMCACMHVLYCIALFCMYHIVSECM